MLIIGILAIIFLPTILGLFQGVAQSMGQSSSGNAGGFSCGPRPKCSDNANEDLYCWEPTDRPDDWPF